MIYQLTSTDAILRLADGAFIPADKCNSDYTIYLQWLEDGSTPEPAPELPAPLLLTSEEKLAASGLTVEELKQLLGLE